MGRRFGLLEASAGHRVGRRLFDVDNMVRRLLKMGFEAAGFEFWRGADGNFTRSVRARVRGSTG
jgi:hypothetical protein